MWGSGGGGGGGLTYIRSQLTPSDGPVTSQYVGAIGAI